MYRLVCIVVVFVSFIAFSAQERDPTQPLSKSLTSKLTQQKKTLKLESIINQGQQKIAIINGRLLKVGDVIAQYRIKEINQNKVILATAENQIELSLFRQVVASPQ
ncbi:agglutinin biogenesis protein MshK [Thalassotalea ganghwensis]